MRAKDLAAKWVMNGLHKTILKVSGGRILGTTYGMPVLHLTTIGRKSGQRRTNMLTSPVQDGDKVVIVASYGGDDRHPAWYLNLVANPEVEITMQGRTRTMRARVASAEEKQELWPRITKAYKGYAAYQKRTERDIPVVILEPAN